jgi:hypothetical protein
MSRTGEFKAQGRGEIKNLAAERRLNMRKKLE